MISALKKILTLFNAKERKQAYFLFILVITRSLFEVAGVASIAPFIAVAANPDVIFSNTYLFYAYDFLEFNSTKSFLSVLGLGVFAVLLINNGLAALTDWQLVRFTLLRGHSLAHRLYVKYLSQPYAYFLNRHSSEITSNIITEVAQFMKGVLNPFIDMISKLIVSICIMILLIAVDPVLALIVSSVLGTAFSVVFLMVKKNLKKVGLARSFHTQQQVLCLKESLSGIKEIKVNNSENYFSKRFEHHSYWTNMSQVSHQVVSKMPKYALEVVGFGGILLITIYLLATEKNSSSTIPLLALYAFAGYRLMPSLQSVFVGITNLRYNFFLIDKLTQDLQMDSFSLEEIENWDKSPQILSLKHNLQIKSVTYAYPETKIDVLKSIDLNIKSKTTVGLVGMTGSGKTTLIDVILGLLQPDKGSLLVDGKTITKSNIKSWLNCIGYVPQHIFLSDASIRDNIAFGIPTEKINEDSIRHAATLANLDQFVEKELPESYDTKVGESGVRLSGGQRQRIGIARALYHNPDIIIFDEATSALDNLTEKNVLQSINSIKNHKTIIMIAHRLTTLKECDVIYVMSKGKTVSQGHFQKLSETCPYFKTLSATLK